MQTLEQIQDYYMQQLRQNVLPLSGESLLNAYNALKSEVKNNVATLYGTQSDQYYSICEMIEYIELELLGQ